MSIFKNVKLEKKMTLNYKIRCKRKQSQQSFYILLRRNQEQIIQKKSELTEIK